MQVLLFIQGERSCTDTPKNGRPTALLGKMNV
jgi:hypothetical protein